MAALKPTSEPAQHPDSALRLPATRRIATQASQRLSMITQGGHLAPPAPAIPARSVLRQSTSTGASAETAPPPYGWVSQKYGDAPEYQANDEDGTRPVEGDEVAELRRKEWMGGQSPASGYRRLGIVALVFLTIMGLAVGLGVGLTVGRKHNAGNAVSNNGTSDGSTQQPGSNSSVIQQFPLGAYSFATALQQQSTNCTTNTCLLYTSPSPRDGLLSRMPSSA